MIKRTSGLIIPKDHNQYNIFKNQLTRRMQQWDDSYKEVLFYLDRDDYIIIPRFLPILDDIQDESCDGDDIDINLKPGISPRTKRQKKAIEYLSNNNSGVLQLEPGSGKTFCAIASICKIKKKTIIFSHKTELLDQWKSEFLKFTDIDKDDIVKLSSKNYKKIQDKKILLCTPHLLSIAVTKNNKKFLEAYNNYNIGIMINDECHVVSGPESFTKSSIVTNCKRTFGLSATPVRQQNQDIIFYHLGEIVKFDAEEDELIKPIINIIKWNYNINKKSYKYINWGNKFSLPKYCNQMKKSKEFNKIVVAIINKCYNEGRTILVAGNITNVLIDLAKKCNLPKEDVGIFIAGAGKKALEVSDTDDLKTAFKTKRVIFSTWGMARDGNNRETLDTLICTTPSTNVEQSAGRILRKCENKKQPIIFDLVDIDPTIKKIWNSEKTEKIQKFEKSLEDRKLIYNKFGWTINERII